jgi:hypothetical protein
MFQLLTLRWIRFGASFDASCVEFNECDQLRHCGSQPEHEEIHKSQAFKSQIRSISKELNICE